MNRNGIGTHIEAVDVLQDDELFKLLSRQRLLEDMKNCTQNSKGDGVVFLPLFLAFLSVPFLLVFVLPMVGAREVAPQCAPQLREFRVELFWFGKTGSIRHIVVEDT